MRVAAALVPPPSAQVALANAISRVSGPAASLDIVDASEFVAPLASFGFVTLGDVDRLADALRASIADVPPLSLRFGVLAPPDAEDDVWVSLEGDLEQLAHAVGTIGDVVRRLGFMVDRRGSHSQVRVGRAGSPMSADELHLVNIRIESAQGLDWVSTELSLVSIHLLAGDQRHFETVDTFPLTGRPAR